MVRQNINSSASVDQKIFTGVGVPEKSKATDDVKLPPPAAGPFSAQSQGACNAGHEAQS